MEPTTLGLTAEDLLCLEAEKDIIEMENSKCEICCTQNHTICPIASKSKIKYLDWVVDFEEYEYLQMRLNETNFDQKEINCVLMDKSKSLWSARIVQYMRSPNKGGFSDQYWIDLLLHVTRNEEESAHYVTHVYAIP